MIFPEILDGHVMGLFTDKELSTDIRPLTGRPVYMPIQKHTDRVLEVDPALTPREGDAVITDRFDIIIGIKTADCVPILVFDTQRLIIGAVHAGWRGTASGILKKTISAMGARYKSRPEDMLIAMGPSIRWCCYTVGQDVLDAVSATTGKGEYHYMRDGNICLDLQSANKYQALSLGVPQESISITEECTYCYPDRYHSFRYNQTDKRQGGFIGLP